MTPEQIETYTAMLAFHGEAVAKLYRDGIMVPYKGSQINVPWDEYKRMTFDELLAYCESSPPKA